MQSEKPIENRDKEQEALSQTKIKAAEDVLQKLYDEDVQIPLAIAVLVKEYKAHVQQCANCREELRTCEGCRQLLEKSSKFIQEILESIEAK